MSYSSESFTDSEDYFEDFLEPEDDIFVNEDYYYNDQSIKTYDILETNIEDNYIDQYFNVLNPDIFDIIILNIEALVTSCDLLEIFRYIRIYYELQGNIDKLLFGIFSIALKMSGPISPSIIEIVSEYIKENNIETVDESIIMTVCEYLCRAPKTFVMHYINKSFDKFSEIEPYLSKEFNLELEGDITGIIENYNLDYFKNKIYNKRLSSIYFFKQYIKSSKSSNYLTLIEYLLNSLGDNYTEFKSSLEPVINMKQRSMTSEIYENLSLSLIGIHIFSVGCNKCDPIINKKIIEKWNYKLQDEPLNITIDILKFSRDYETTNIVMYDDFFDPNSSWRNLYLSLYI